MSTFSDTELRLVAQELPAAPRLLVEIGQLLRRLNVDVADITALLRQDTALVARLIRMANSPVYGRAEPAGSLEEALACVGFREVHRLIGVVAASTLAGESLQLYGIEGDRLQKNSLLTAVLMEELAVEAGEDPAGCYTVGLLRSIGKMALNRLADPAAGVAFAASGETELDVWEHKQWGLTNCEAAEKILLHWRLPSDTVISIRHHYRPDHRHNPIIHLLNLAAGAAEDRLLGLPGEAPFWQHTRENFAKAGIDEKRFLVASERAQRTFRRLCASAG